MTNSDNILTNDLIAKIRRIEITTRKLVNDSFAGEYHSVFKGRGMEFIEVRQYHPGDDVRTIDWNVTARTGEPSRQELRRGAGAYGHARGRLEPLRRLRHEEPSSSGSSPPSLPRSCPSRPRRTMTRSDCSSSPTGVELLIPPRKGRSHVLRMVRDLLVFEPEGTGTDIRLALDTINVLLKRRSIVFVISDFLAEPDSYRQALFATSRRHDVVAFDLDDPMEREIADVGIIALEDAETGQLRWVDTSSSAWRRTFSEKVARFVEEKREVFSRAAVDRVNVTTDRDYVAEVASFFKNRLRRLAQGV